jgi:hypothetical protein
MLVSSVDYRKTAKGGARLDRMGAGVSAGAKIDHEAPRERRFVAV